MRVCRARNSDDGDSDDKEVKMAIGRSVEYSIVKADKVISWRKRKEDGMEKQKRVKKLEEKGD